MRLPTMPTKFPIWARWVVITVFVVGLVSFLESNGCSGYPVHVMDNEGKQTFDIEGMGFWKVTGAKERMRVGPLSSLEVAPGEYVGGPTATRAFLRSTDSLVVGDEVASLVDADRRWICIFGWHPGTRVPAENRAAFWEHSRARVQEWLNWERLRRHPRSEPFIEAFASAGDYERERLAMYLVLRRTRHENVDEDHATRQFEQWLPGRRGTVRATCARGASDVNFTFANQLTPFNLDHRLEFAPGEADEDARPDEKMSGADFIPEAPSEISLLYADLVRIGYVLLLLVAILPRLARYAVKLIER